jgi:hypothetical protein
MNPEEAIRENAKLVVAQFSQPGMFGPGFGYDRASVEYVAEFIEGQRAGSAQQTGKLVSILGSYLGECLVRELGGRWKNDDGQWTVFFSDKLSAFPLNKVEKQFANGRDQGDDILGFFDSCIALLHNG